MEQAHTVQTQTAQPATDMFFGEGRLPASIDTAVRDALAHLDRDLPWCRTMDDGDRTLLDVVIVSAVADFLAWRRQLRDGSHDGVDAGPESDHVFFVPPMEFARAITLHQALEVTRLVMRLLDDHAAELADSADDMARTVDELRRYGSEVAFAAAEAYATSADAHGDWAVGLEAQVIEDLCDGVTDHHVDMRMNLLGWDRGLDCFAVAGRPRADGVAPLRSLARSLVRGMGGDCMMAEHDGLTVMLVAAHGQGAIDDCRRGLAGLFDGMICVGPCRRGIDGASRTVRAALRTHDVLPAIVNRLDTDVETGMGTTLMEAVPDGVGPASGMPAESARQARIILADDVRPERALMGDADAREELADVYRQLRDGAARRALPETVMTFLLSGSSVELTARRLRVHPNTVRYRLRHSAEVTGWDPMDARESYALLTAITIGLIQDARRTD